MTIHRKLWKTPSGTRQRHEGSMKREILIVLAQCGAESPQLGERIGLHYVMFTDSSGEPDTRWGTSLTDLLARLVRYRDGLNGRVKGA